VFQIPVDSSTIVAAQQRTSECGSKRVKIEKELAMKYSVQNPLWSYESVLTTANGKINAISNATISLD
jgi:hypothetical protein